MSLGRTKCPWLRVTVLNNFVVIKTNGRFSGHYLWSVVDILQGGPLKHVPSGVIPKRVIWWSHQLNVDDLFLEYCSSTLGSLYLDSFLQKPILMSWWHSSDPEVCSWSSHGWKWEPACEWVQRLGAAPADDRWLRSYMQWVGPHARRAQTCCPFIPLPAELCDAILSA